MIPTIPMALGARASTTRSWHIRQIGIMATLMIPQNPKDYFLAMQIERNPQLPQWAL